MIGAPKGFDIELGGYEIKIYYSVYCALFVATDEINEYKRKVIKSKI